jgi:hypothetical protein
MRKEGSKKKWWKNTATLPQKEHLMYEYQEETIFQKYCGELSE